FVACFGTALRPNRKEIEYLKGNRYSCGPIGRLRQQAVCGVGLSVVWKARTSTKECGLKIEMRKVGSVKNVFPGSDDVDGCRLLEDEWVGGKVRLRKTSARWRVEQRSSIGGYRITGEPKSASQIRSVHVNRLLRLDELNSCGCQFGIGA